MATQAPDARYLTEKQYQLLGLIDSFLKEHRYAPSVRELRQALGLSSSGTIHRHLENMRTEGVIDWVDEVPRTVHLTKLGDAALIYARRR